MEDAAVPPPVADAAVAPGQVEAPGDDAFLAAFSQLVPGGNHFSFSRAEDKQLLAIVRPVALSLSSSQDLVLSSSLEGSGTTRIDFTSYRPLWSTPFWEKHVPEFSNRTAAHLVVRFCELYLNQEQRTSSSGADRPDAFAEYANKLTSLPKDVQEMLVLYVKVPVYRAELEEMQSRETRRLELRKEFLDVFHNTTEEYMRLKDRDALFVNTFDATEKELWAAFYDYMFGSPAYKTALLRLVLHLRDRPSKLFEGPEVSSRARLVADVIVKVLFQSGYLSPRDVASLAQVPVFQKLTFANRHLLIRHCPNMLSHVVVIDNVARFLSPSGVNALAATNRAARARLQHLLRLRMVAQCPELQQDLAVAVELGSTCRDFLVALHRGLSEELEQSGAPRCTPEVFLRTVRVSQEGVTVLQNAPLLECATRRLEVAKADCIFDCESDEPDVSSGYLMEGVNEPMWGEGDYMPQYGQPAYQPMFVEDDYAYPQFLPGQNEHFDLDDGFAQQRRVGGEQLELSHEECMSLVAGVGVDEEVALLLSDLSLSDVASDTNRLDFLSTEQRRTVVNRAKAIRGGQPWAHARLPQPNFGVFQQHRYVPQMSYP